MDNKKIFIIEDDANLLYGLESQFSADEFEVDSATGDEDMEELIQAIRDFEPDIIILDLILPKIDGFDIIKKIKSDDELTDKQIFIFTDLSDEDSRQRSLNLGADYVFFKEEFDTFEFAEKVKRIVSKNKSEMDRDYEE